jgi:hypothetical protein
VKACTWVGLGVLTLAVSCGRQRQPDIDEHQLLSATDVTVTTAAGDSARIRARVARLEPRAVDGLRTAARQQPGTPWIIRFTLFADVDVEGIVRYVEIDDSAGVHVTGRLTGEASGGSFALVTRGKALYAHLQVPDNRYFEIHGRDTTALVEELDNAKLPSVEAVRDVAAPQTSNVPPARLTADGTVITVLVMYTKAARDQAAVAQGDPPGSATAINLIIDAARDESRTILRDSDVDTRYDVVARELTSFNEPNSTTPDELGAILDELTAKGDNILDEAHTLRDTYKADVVILLAADPKENGIAWHMGTPSVSFQAQAFGVVNWKVAAGFYTFAHEIGHILGNRHNVEEDAKKTPYPYSHGYQFTGEGKRWYTVMSYRWKSGDAGTRIPLHSTPRKTFASVPAGDAATADAARTAQATRVFVANFRQ